MNDQTDETTTFSCASLALVGFLLAVAIALVVAALVLADRGSYTGAAICGLSASFTGILGLGVLEGEHKRP